MSTCKQLDLDSVGSWPIMPKNFPSTEENNSSPQKPRGVGYGYEGVWFWVGTWDARGRFWDHGGRHVGLWSSLGLVPDYVVLVLGTEGGGPQHMQGHHTRDLGIGLRKLVVLTLNIHQNIQLRLVWIFFFIYINHIALKKPRCTYLHRIWDSEIPEL